MMNDHGHRRNVELARCRAALMSAHAHLCESIATRLCDRLEPERLAGLYSRAHELSPLDDAWVRIHTLANCGLATPRSSDGARNHEGLHTWFGLRERVRANIAPFGDPELQEALAFELAHAGAILLKVHVRNAVTFAHAVAADLRPAAAVTEYIQRMEVPAEISGAVYSLALTRLATREVASPPQQRLSAALTPARSP